MAADTQQNWIEDIEEASKVPSKRRGTSIKPTVEKLTESLYEDGALPEDLVRLIKLITHPGHLDQASISAIIRNLYPATRVPNDAVLEVLGSLGHGKLKPSLTVQSNLLRWLITVHHVLEEPETLSRSYSLLFNLLDTAAIRPQLCHILALITRRKHVRPYRIQAVLELSRQTGGEPTLTGLLRVFKNYYPEIIVGTAVKGRAAAFKHPDTSWRERLDEIQEDHRSKMLSDETGPRNGFRVKHLLSKQMAGNKSKLPAVHTLRAQENSVTLEEIDSVDSFVGNLEKIELPSQIVAVFGDPLLQKLMLLRPRHDASTRVGNWIQGCIADVRTGDADASVLLDVIEVLQDYVSANKTLPPIITPLFQDLFAIWDGTDRHDAVLNVFSHIPSPQFLSQPDWNAFYITILQPFEHAILAAYHNIQAAQLILLNFYTTLLQNWSILIFSHQRAQGNNNSDQDLTHITSLILHIHTLTSTLTQTSPSSTTDLHILDFLKTTASLTSHPNSPISLFPLGLTVPTTQIYALLFSHSPAVLSSLSDIVATYKRGLESHVSARLSRQTWTAAETEKLASFNGFLMDTCNCLWRRRAFGTSDKNAQGCRVHADVIDSLRAYMTDIQLEHAFELSSHPALVSFAADYVGEMEEDAGIAEERRSVGPVTQKSLAAGRGRGGLQMSWQEYRLGVLRYLEEKGFGGVPRLMYNTMKPLMGDTSTVSAGSRSQSQSQSRRQF